MGRGVADIQDEFEAFSVPHRSFQQECHSRAARQQVLYSAGDFRLILRELKNWAEAHFG